MKQYEYKIIETEYPIGENQLNQFGERGWKFIYKHIIKSNFIYAFIRKHNIVDLKPFQLGVILTDNDIDSGSSTTVDKNVPFTYTKDVVDLGPG